MCRYCTGGIDIPWDTPIEKRPIPRESGEGAIYTPEYLARKEGSSLGALSELWRDMYVPGGM